MLLLVEVTLRVVQEDCATLIIQNLAVEMVIALEAQHQPQHLTLAQVQHQFQHRHLLELRNAVGVNGVTQVRVVIIRLVGVVDCAPLIGQ